MKLRLLLLILMPVTLFSNEPEILSQKYGIDTFKRGNINFFSINDNESKSYLLDSGNLINSRIFLKDGDSRFYLRSRGEYAVSREDNDIIIKWRTENLNVYESFIDNGSGYNYTIKLENRSDKERSIGALIVYDTLLGENSGNHFVINGDKIVDRQHSYSGKDIPKTILSRDERNIRLEFIMPADLSDYPDNLILGNWNRLAYSKKWPYSPTENSLFSYGLYSINDSAIGLFYGGRYVTAGESVEFSYVIKILEDIPSSETEIIVNDLDDKSSKWIQEEVITEDKSDIDTITNIDDTKSEIELDDNHSSITDIVVDKESLDDTVSETEIVVEEPVKVDNNNMTITLDGKEPSEEDLQIMLDYIAKKRNGEDVSGYNFDEEYIMRVLEGTDE